MGICARYFAVIALLWGALALAPAPARAYEDQLTVGVGVGWGHLVSETDPARNGILTSVDSSLGLDDIWALRAHFSWGYHPDPVPLNIFVLGGEILYLIDILEIVPYLGGGLDGLGAARNGGFGAEMGVHLALGADWHLSRSWALGLVFRPTFLFTDMSNPFYLATSLSLQALIDL